MEVLDIVKLKSDIENRTISDKLLVFEYSDNPFLAYQYVKAISETRNKKLLYVEELSQIFPQDSIFGDNSNDNLLKIYSCEELKDLPNHTKINNAIIITKKSISLPGYTVSMPKLEAWHIKDYLYSMVTGVDTKYLDFLLDICNNDIYRIQQEIDKFLIFNEGERKFLFQDMLDDNAFGDLSSKTVFDFSNALITKNIQALSFIYNEIENIDISEMGLLTILLQNFRNIISIQLSKNATAESLGMKQNQFFAIKRNINHYSGEQLVKIYRFLLDIDKKVKTGEITIDILRDYIVVNILGV